MTRPRSSTPRSLFDRLLAPQAQEAGGVGETMAQKVSILDGEVNRNWHLKDSNGEKHLLSLFHDCVTGARAAMLDYEEVPGSAGTTNVFNLVSGRVDIPFSMRKGSEKALDSGCLAIVRRGLTGFSYECEVNGKLVLDTTSVVQNTDYEYEVSMPATVDTGSRVSGVTWYEVHTMRRKDGKGTLVHRRYRDFYSLHEQVESLMKGHHLRSSLPRFPGKKSKLWTNHGDLSFVEDRRRALEQYLKTLLQLPHVSTLDSTRAFLGMVGNLREFSVPWEGKELGATLKRASEVAGGRLAAGGGSAGPNGCAGAPPVITSVQGKGKSPPGVYPGDRLFKVNGDSTELMSLEAAWSSVARAARPVMLHFLGPILRMDSTLTPLPEAFLRHRTIPGRQNALPGDGGPKENSNSADAANPDRSQWSFRGMWAARKPQGPTGKGESRGPPGGAVGPFGNGAGAAGTGRNLPANSRLFGGSAAGVGGKSAEHSKDSSSFESWRAQEGAGLGAGGGSRLPGRPVTESHSSGGGGTGSSKGSSHWTPDFSRGSAGSTSSAVPAGGRFSAGEVGASMDFPATSSVSHGGNGNSSFAAPPVYPPKQQTAPAAREGAPGEGGRRKGGGSGGETFSNSGFYGSGAGARFQPGDAHQPPAAGSFGTAIAVEAESIGGGIEEDNEEDDENPFA